MYGSKFSPHRMNALSFVAVSASGNPPRNQCRCWLIALSADSSRLMGDSSVNAIRPANDSDTPLTKTGDAVACKDKTTWLSVLINSWPQLGK